MVRKNFMVCLTLVILGITLTPSLFAEENLVTKTLFFKFQEVSSIKDKFEKLISDKGKIEIFSENNAIRITDVPSNVEVLKKMAEDLDKPSKQFVVKIRWFSASPIDSQQPWGISELRLLSSIDGMLQDKELIKALNKRLKNTRLKLLLSPIILTLEGIETEFDIKSETEKFDVNILPKIIAKKPQEVIQLETKWDIKENYFRSLNTNLVFKLKDKETIIKRIGGFDTKGKITDRWGKERLIGEVGEYIFFITVFAVNN